MNLLIFLIFLIGKDNNLNCQAKLNEIQLNLVQAIYIHVDSIVSLQVKYKNNITIKLIKLIYKTHD